MPNINILRKVVFPGGAGGYVNRYSMYHDGVDEYFDLGDILDDITTGANAQFTITAWIKPAAAMTNNAIFSKISTTDDQRQYLLRLSTDSKVGFLWYGLLNGNSYRGWLGTTPITDTNKWYHVAMVYDGTQAINSRVKIYVDGVDDLATINLTFGTPVSIPDGTAHLGIGAFLNSAGAGIGGYFNGNIDESYFLNTNLSQPNVALLASTSQYNVRNHPNYANLAEGYRMGDGAVWNGTIWTMPGIKSTYSAVSVNMEEASRRLDVAA